ncbi:MAG: YjjG family noncanonical pyrimidine nucleotidase [Emticicia sp.]|uniref:YjjG family noncanonical pyrimidine nucleotidase n=1 Tax=Emticicia sp. TaxID=1930953 RepID=UPI003BA40FC2
MAYKHLFFDLDHTLWDFERNSAECLADIYEIFDFKSLNISTLEAFQQEFSVVNKRQWSLLEQNLITHDELRRRRFQETLENLGVKDLKKSFGLEINEYFLELLPKKAHLIEGAVEVLDYLLPKYELHIISNGWQDIQVNKMKSSEIHHYFGEIITNELAGTRKPDRRIFDYALETTKANLAESLMIGDNYEADILGAINANIDTVFYNPDNIPTEQKPTFDIKKLVELKEIL